MFHREYGICSNLQLLNFGVGRVHVCGISPGLTSYSSIQMLPFVTATVNLSSGSHSSGNIPPCFMARVPGVWMSMEVMPSFLLIVLACHEHNSRK